LIDPKIRDSCQIQEDGNFDKHCQPYLLNRDYVIEQNHIILHLLKAKDLSIQGASFGMDTDSAGREISLVRCAAFPTDCATCRGDCTAFPTDCVSCRGDCAAFPTDCVTCRGDCAALPTDCVTCRGDCAAFSTDCVSCRGDCATFSTDCVSAEGTDGEKTLTHRRIIDSAACKGFLKIKKSP